MGFKFDNSMRVLLYGYILIAGLNFVDNWKFRYMLNLTIIIGLGLFWIILEIVQFKKNKIQPLIKESKR